MSEQILDPAPGAPDDDAWRGDPPVDSAGDTAVDAADEPTPVVPAGVSESRFTTQWVVVLITRIVLIGVTTFIALMAMHPRLVLTNSTPTGGDMGAHVWAPAYLRDHLLSDWKLNGWSMDWYSGLPIYRFYMVIPALMITLLNVVLPYGIAFKIVAISGIVTLPLACWAFGRLARLPFPVPEMFAVVGLIYLFDESYTIYGGNIASTMAGEYSFSISLSFAMLGFGLMANGLQTGKYRSTASVVLALAVLSHGIVAIFVTVGLLLMGLLYIDKKRGWYWFTTCTTASLLTAFWIVPFIGNHAFMTDMKYKGEPGSGSFDSYWDMFFALPAFFDVLFTTLAVIGFVISIVRRNLVGAWIGITGVVFSAFVFLFRESIPVFGLLWNPRLLPFVNMCRYLLAALAIYEIVQAIVRQVRHARYVASVQRSVATYGESVPAWALPAPPRSTSLVAGTATAFAFLLVTLAVLGFRFQELPGGEVVPVGDGFEYQWGIGPLKATTDYGNDGFVDGWARWNFSGYEGKPYFGEYRDVVQTMKELGQDPAHGCGRALWENYSENDKYGTTMALMLLPFWTDGCIGSSEGLFFEASGTTPYHFLAAAAMSKQSSNPVRELRYENNDAEVGVPYLQDLGMKYYMAVTPEAIAEAEQQPELTLIDTAGPWHIYEVASSDIVVPLDVQPVVVNQRSGDQRERWLELGTSWYQNREEWAALPVADGPDDWQRIDAVVDLERQIGANPGDSGRQVDVVVPGTEIQPVALDPVEVSDVVVGNESVSFSVDQIGVPVLVRVSYFPNWKVDGADGPYRVAPNMMIVVPTDTEVRLHFDRNVTDIIAYFLTLIGIVLLFVWWRVGPVRYDDASPVSGEPDVVTWPFTGEPAMVGAMGDDPPVEEASTGPASFVPGVGPPGEWDPLTDPVDLPSPGVMPADTSDDGVADVDGPDPAGPSAR